MARDETEDYGSPAREVGLDTESESVTGRPLAGREAVIEEQRRTISELQTPVIQVWDRILALPIVGSLDTNRTQEMTEALLERIVATESEIVILDITAVPVVDTAVAKHLLETVAAARLLGAEVLIVGLSTRTAMTLVHLGIDLAGVTTRVTMAKGLELAFGRLGLEVVARREGSTRANYWSTDGDGQGDGGGSRRTGGGGTSPDVSGR